MKEFVPEGMLVVDRLALDGRDDIASFEPGSIRGPSRLDVGDIDAVLRGQSITSCQGGGDGHPTDPQVWAGEVTVGDELFCDDPGGVAWDSKPQSLSHSAALAAAAHDERIDSNDLAGEVDERAAGVALVDGRIRLDQTFQEKAFFYLDGAFRGANDAQRYGICVATTGSPGFNASELPHSATAGISPSAFSTAKSA